MASPASPSSAGLETPQEGAPCPLSPRLAPALCTPALGLAWPLWQQLLRGPGGPGQQPGPTTRPLPEGLPPPRCPFGLCDGARDRLADLGCQPSAGAPVPGVPCPAFALASPTPGACCTCAARGGGAVGAPHTLPTSPSSQPLPHLRGFSDAGSHAPCCPQLEVGRPALKLTASPKGPLQGGVGEP